MRKWASFCLILLTVFVSFSRPADSQKLLEYVAQGDTLAQNRSALLFPRYFPVRWRLESVLEPGRIIFFKDAGQRRYPKSVSNILP
ncbi:MAG: hypothetical protein AMJ92_02195 [candidate division Zixibacteria bacterium SM23_81]|nr:MAG: hypothetical protein AMJ92_02195 [candidate division Zixibacteria bacterium SM23_81]